MGVNVTMARRAGLLHDIGKALDHEIEGSHIQIGVEIARKYKENTQIIHAIEAHHGDVEPKTGASSFRRPTPSAPPARARRENVESYVKRLENLEEISFQLRGCGAGLCRAGRPRRRILVASDVISDDQVILLARPLPKRSRIRWITPARSRSTSSARAAPWSTQNKVFSAGCRVFARQPVFCAKTIAFPSKKVSWMQKKAKELRPCGRRPATTQERKGASFYEKLEEITGLLAGRFI